MTFRERLLAGERLVGCFLNTGSAVAAEICASAGFDWVLLDLEHGSATEADLLPQLQAVAHTAAAPLVRVEANERPRITKALDLGAEGVMVPRIGGAEDAARAVAHLRYGPAGVRGVALLNRAAGYGVRGRETVESFNERVVGVVQIETEPAVAEADEIAALDGVDCLFVGPADLTHALGIFLDTDDRRYTEAVERVRRAAAAHGKATGVLVRSREEALRYHELGFRLIAFGSDASFLVSGAREAIASVP
ncbi:MAG TPA: aldolase/citrate lyase family protein [Gaiellaceae bacterium]|jgi:2-keto-3-deoxy-L-rhamnonate aldolase RhmA|nr:aldolase/citrate lyase family protein [Gaiellaceae bacterium]